tara:strand:- start:464 stop:694 length:231 start_codon:yes stop_codon:yes gene_type:complete
MKKSKKPSVRIKRAVKQLTEANPRYEIGNVLFEIIINLGVQEAKNQLKEMDRTKNHFIGPEMWEHCIEILEENLEL